MRNRWLGGLSSIVVDAQPHQSRRCEFVGAARKTYVGDYAGTLQVGNDQRVARQYVFAVVVAEHVAVLAGGSTGGRI